MVRSRITSQSGRALDELTMDVVRRGELNADDFRISKQTLNQQAAAAEEAGYRQLAENLRRAAEITGLSNQEALDVYNLLRPGRATYAELIALADRLQSERAMPLVAAFIREAAEAYGARGITKS